MSTTTRASDILGSPKSYKGKLSDDRWITFSNAVKEQRDHFCECCRQKKPILNVHHVWYDWDKEPWEYNDDAVVVLCTQCHHELHVELQKFRRFVFRHLNPQTFRVFNGACLVGLQHYDGLILMHAFAELVSTPNMLMRYADAWGATPEKK